MIKAVDRCKGALLGLACGDAVGTTAEFQERGSFVPVTDMWGGGHFNLEPGQWTDDTSMALCMAASLIEKKEVDLFDQMIKYVNWWNHGYMSSTGECFDIGMTTARSLNHFLLTDDPRAGVDDERQSGNGGLMRQAPIVIWNFYDWVAAMNDSVQVTMTTHGSRLCLFAARLWADILWRALQGVPKEELLTSTVPYEHEALSWIANTDYTKLDRDKIRGTGYVVDSMKAALWCFANSDSYRMAVLMATNLGDDADTTAAIVGQLAGAHYGKQGIPEQWLKNISMGMEIEQMAADLYFGGPGAEVESL